MTPLTGIPLLQHEPVALIGSCPLHLLRAYHEPLLQHELASTQEGSRTMAARHHGSSISPSQSWALTVLLSALQNQREITLAGFRKGNFSVLVATDVAARGLDITGVELVVQMEPPKDTENYIHRSGALSVWSWWGFDLNPAGTGGAHEAPKAFSHRTAGHPV